MNPHYGYGWEKLYKAVNTMATADTSLEERLKMALSEVSLIGQKNAPDEIWEEVQAIVQEGSRVAAKGDEGAFAASIAAMDELQRGDFAEKIFDCFVRMAEFER